MNLQLAQTNTTSGHDKSIQLVTFYLSGEEYGLGITRIREIIGMVPITRLPHASNYVQGLINLRGEVIPIFDMRCWFGLSHIPGSSNSIVIAEWGAEYFGFMVDSVHQVVWLPQYQIDPPTIHFQKRSPYIMGLGKYEGRILILLDLEALFRGAEEEAIT
ncbi:MAG: chemotaxis protein CheW [Cyanobacteria bacterium NC_groundwater_1444_Ag_S-0.65um_54_12]|nr:chemotaxis protein CheW [Cyanobacteria bacterium NC_groundwater_1444_Ag_S-0.65um_54_12]